MSYTLLDPSGNIVDVKDLETAARKLVMGWGYPGCPTREAAKVTGAAIDDAIEWLRAGDLAAPLDLGE